MIEIPDLDALHAEIARREPARAWILAGSKPTKAEQASIDEFHQVNPLALAILHVIVDPPAWEERS